MVRLLGVRAMPGDNLLDGTEPCVVVLVGVQIATHLLDNWTWGTYWFTPRSNDHDTDGRNADKLPVPFHHFAMDILLSPDVVPGDPHSLPPIFNPYLEGPHANGALSNCLSCHANAAFVPACTVGTAACLKLGPRAGIRGPEAAGEDPNPACVMNAAGHMEGSCIKTSFLWSLATGQDPESDEPMKFNISPSQMKIPVPLLPPNPK